jgi:two-component system, sensor histidine kinase RegB
MVLTDPDVRSWWLIRLRWGSVAGQAIIIVAGARISRVQLPVATLLALCAVMAVSNLALHAWLRRSRCPISGAWAGSILAFDVAQLTALLYFTGGASNPFSVFYLVQITAAAATLGSRWTWTLTALGVSAYAGLFLLPMAAPADSGVHAAHDFARHLQTMWVALTVAAALTAFFVTRLTTSLARRDEEIAAMREAAARRERLSALTTLAAGAAHELATPLTTVAVAAGELEREVSALPGGATLADDVRLIRSEVARCREILDEIGVGSGSASGEMPARFTGDDLVRDVLARLRSDLGSRVEVEAPAAPSAVLFLPRRAVGRVVLSLVQNAIDASPPGAGVQLRVAAGAELEVVVSDRGSGMGPDVVSRAAEPFFTTKPPGQGLGLGLFLGRSLADQLGGRLAIESARGQGTRVTLRLPLEVDAHVQRI